MQTTLKQFYLWVVRRGTSIVCQQSASVTGLITSARLCRAISLTLQASFNGALRSKERLGVVLSDSIDYAIIAIVNLLSR